MNQILTNRRGAATSCVARDFRTASECDFIASGGICCGPCSLLLQQWLFDESNARRFVCCVFHWRVTPAHCHCKRRSPVLLALLQRRTTALTRCARRRPSLTQTNKQTDAQTDMDINAHSQTDGQSPVASGSNRS